MHFAVEMRVIYQKMRICLHDYRLEEIYLYMLAISERQIRRFLEERIHETMQMRWLCRRHAVTMLPYDEMIYRQPHAFHDITVSDYEAAMMKTQSEAVYAIFTTVSNFAKWRCTAINLP